MHNIKTVIIIPFVASPLCHYQNLILVIHGKGVTASSHLPESFTADALNSVTASNIMNSFGGTNCIPDDDEHLLSM